VVSLVTSLGRESIALLEEPVLLVRFAWQVVLRAGAQLALLRPRWRETIDQIFSIGVQSLPVVAFSLTFIALMMILEFSFHMKMVLQQDSLVPVFSTLLM